MPTVVGKGDWEKGRKRQREEKKTKGILLTVVVNRIDSP